MIKQIKLENIYGIRKFEVDFMLKNIQEDTILENQIIKDEKDNISLSPLFLAKNAAGKTSFIKAVNFVLRFATKKDFVKELSHYKMSSINTDIKNFMKDQLNQKNIDTQLLNLHLKNSEHYTGDHIISQLFHEISFSGSQKVLIEILLVKNRKIVVEITNSSFILQLNEKTINIKYILNSLNIKNTFNKSPNETLKEVKDELNKNSFFFDDFNNFDLNFDSIFRDINPITKINEITLKRLTNMHISLISKKMGFKPTSLLLKKLDSNISSIKFDSENNEFEIYLKSASDQWPISPSSLSFGTQKCLEVLAKSIYLFENGGVLMIDEIENGLHLSIIKLILAFYSDPNINKKNAQIILTTHNPLIAERDIVSSKNVYMVEKDNFISVKKMKIKLRTEDSISMIKSKNYYNDIFWTSKGSKSKSSLSNLAISHIINTFLESVKWQQGK